MGAPRGLEVGARLLEQVDHLIGVARLLVALERGVVVVGRLVAARRGERVAAGAIGLGRAREVPGPLEELRRLRKPEPVACISAASSSRPAASNSLAARWCSPRCWW